MIGDKLITHLDLADFSDMQLPMLTIYERPADYPDLYVVRVWECLPTPQPTNMVVLTTTLEEARRRLPQGYQRISRSEIDDPKIVETYI